MPYFDTHYFLINPELYRPFLPALIEKLSYLQGNFVTYQNEIHRESRFAICQYDIAFKDGRFDVTYDPVKSRRSTVDKKTYTAPDLLDCDAVKGAVLQFLNDIGDMSLTKVEVKLIQTDVFPFIFNPHRDSQFRRLRHIQFLATLLVTTGGISGGEMQLFHSKNDKIGPFELIEELPIAPGVGYIVDERPQVVFHGMKPAYALDNTAHRAALLLRFFK